MEEVIAKLNLVCVHPSGERFAVCVEIGKPYAVRDGKGTECAACPVSMRGLCEEMSDVRGEDTFQALSLALALVRKLLSSFVEGGGRVLFGDEDEGSFEFGAYFPDDPS